MNFWKKCVITNWINQKFQIFIRDVDHWLLEKKTKNVLYQVIDLEDQDPDPDQGPDPNQDSDSDQEQDEDVDVDQDQDEMSPCEVKFFTLGRTT